ncbi:plasmid pRiA4b ORF-3 family protein [Sporosarcina sp. FSL W8-0480]|uniref:plasmid pRiA4b ORF-3 family protein n=1 Tax=Sporosarcina sp. FSL W8-0480 TaxID=2954701 RepID=UPI0030D9A154
MINELIRAMLLTIRNSDEYDLFPIKDKKRLEEIMAFVGGEEVDLLMSGIMDMDAPHQHYQLKVTLKGSKPPIWRRIVIPGYYTFEELHLVIQEAMGWDNYHLYLFEYGDFIIDPEAEDDDSFNSFFAPARPKLDATDTMIAELMVKEGDKCQYTYDFGDDWQHTIVLEKILPADEERQVPVCLKGKRACPPEDCGGILGFESMLATLEGPDTDEKTHLLDWLGGEFDKEAFNIDYVNANLKELGNEIEEELEDYML